MLKFIRKRISNFLFGFSGTLIYCPFCGSAHVKFGKSQIALQDDKHKETYLVKCKNCGAVGQIHEGWIAPRGREIND